MPKYIDADYFIKCLKAESEYVNVSYTVDEIIRFINDFPTADVQEVVKCGNCKYYRKAEYFKNLTYCVRFSRKNGGFIGCVKCKTDDFCRYGERKEEE